MKISRADFTTGAKVAFVALLLTLGTTVAWAYGTWSDPTDVPSNTNANAAAPITVEGDQTKLGGLIVNATKSDSSFAATGLDVINGNAIVPNGNLSVGTSGGSSQICLNGTCKSGLAPTYYSKSVSSPYASSRGVSDIGAACNSGDYATGGGMTISKGATNPNGANDDITDNFPTITGSPGVPTGWQCGTAKGTAQISCFAVCVHYQ